VQFVCPVPLIQPGGHDTGALDVDAQAEPAGHGVQLPAPNSEYEPDAQSEGAVETIIVHRKTQQNVKEVKSKQVQHKRTSTAGRTEEETSRKRNNEKQQHLSCQEGKTHAGLLDIPFQQGRANTPPIRNTSTTRHHIRHTWCEDCSE
jgi:hypothetical protein